MASQETARWKAAVAYYMPATLVILALLVLWQLAVDLLQVKQCIRNWCIRNWGQNKFPDTEEKIQARRASFTTSNRSSASTTP